MRKSTKKSVIIVTEMRQQSFSYNGNKKSIETDNICALIKTIKKLMKASIPTLLYKKSANYKL